MNENFKNMLIGLSDKNKLEAVNLILAKFREQTAIDNKFYNNRIKTTQCVNKLFDIINTSDPYLETLIRLEANTPYTIFNYILRENFSDILIYNDGYVLTNGGKEERVNIPEELTYTYRLFVTHFIENVVFLSSQKFDTANAILDAEVDGFRFNIIHKTLNVSEFHTMVIRKQIVESTANAVNSGYIESVGASEKQIEVLHKFAKEGNIIIFGETGSGKTTLLRYLGSYDIENKRNLITIEDTQELNIKVPIATITNHHFDIKDLFTASLRQHPSHVIIGETRTDEIVDILEASLTTNVMTTIHANSFVRAIQRIVFMSMKRHIDPEQILSLINASVDCFIYMKNRKIEEIWTHKKEFHRDVYEAYEKVE